MTFPEEFLGRMKQMLGAEFDEFLKALASEVDYRAIRINTLKPGASDAVLRACNVVGKVPWCADGYIVSSDSLSGRHPYHAAGLFYFQEPSAMAAAEASQIKPGMRVLDLCAAPGGKATQAAAMLKGEGVIVANEIITKRAKILSGNIERMGITNAIVTNETPERLEKKFADYFDCIILDAPCSGEGMFRKDPAARQEWSEEHSRACATRQKLIADSAVRMLQEGGRMVYSTCTFAPEENEGVAEYILKQYPEMKIVDIKMDGVTSGRPEWGEGEESLSFTKRIFPHNSCGEGHFVAVFEKQCGRCASGTDMERVKAPEEYRKFCEETLVKMPDKYGILHRFGDTLCVLPEGIDIKGLKVLRAGLEIGTVRKGRLLPAHALALGMSADSFKNNADYSADSPEAEKYLRGETLAGDISGWCSVSVDGFCMGWAKGSDGVLKNHYPKGLRIF